MTSTPRYSLQRPPTPARVRIVRFKGMSLSAKPNEPWYVREARIQGRMKRDWQRRRRG